LRGSANAPAPAAPWLNPSNPLRTSTRTLTHPYGVSAGNMSADCAKWRHRLWAACFTHPAYFRANSAQHKATQITAKPHKFFSLPIFYPSLIFYILSLIYLPITYLLTYLLYTITYSSISYSSLISHIFIPPQSGIVPGRQNTVMRRHCAPEGEAQPPHDGILPAMPLFLRPELGIGLKRIGDRTKAGMKTQRVFAPRRGIPQRLLYMKKQKNLQKNERFLLTIPNS
jgi:hypothetical protein